MRDYRYAESPGGGLFVPVRRGRAVLPQTQYNNIERTFDSRLRRLLNAAHVKH